jgi:hypothetical protein
VSVGVAVRVAVGVRVGVAVEVPVAVLVGVEVTVCVGRIVGVRDGVADAVRVGVTVGTETEEVGVFVGLGELVGEAAAVTVGDSVGIASIKGVQPKVSGLPIPVEKRERSSIVIWLLPLISASALPRSKAFR